MSIPATIIVFLLVSVVSAGVTDGDFELDGNAVSDGNLDWDSPQGVFSGIITDPAPQTIFTTGGSKDTRDLSSWRHTDGTVPDKDDITHAYATARLINGSLVIFFGADRYSQDGDAALGFNFFQDDVQLLPNGRFSGKRREGDLLVVANFGSSQDNVVFEYQNGDFVQVLNSQNSVCGSQPDQEVCSIVNSISTPSPWPYQPKSGPPNVFPVESFFEGGIDLNRVFAGRSVPCFSTFLAVTRSSSSLTSQLKDFVLGSFKLCGLQVELDCHGGRPDNTNTIFVYDYTVTVKNTGFGVLHNVSVVFDGATLFQSLSAGEERTVNGSFTSLESAPFIGRAFVSAVVDDKIINASSAIASCPSVVAPTGMDLIVNCDSVAPDSTESQFVYNFSGTVSNTGFGDLNLTGLIISGGTETVYESVTGIILSPSPASNIFAFSGQLVSAIPISNLTARVSSIDYRGFTVLDLSNVDVCPLLNVVPSISVNKTCIADLVQVGNYLTIKVTYFGHVCNTGDLRLNDVSVVESSTSNEQLFYLGSILQNSCVFYNSTYFPVVPAVDFTDTVSVNSTATLGFGYYTTNSSASCGICPVCA
uniref:Uncharacterized protein n=1 Tax=Marseillevirus LCMAC201 TaxID=2506605 RepID=A0A481YWN8_9VIRU|nr:MAG: hypothetical protein LCMAC201_04290 [Marseillevirus LCMAC201]